MAIFKGAGVAIVTPFKEDGSVNYDKFAELIEFQIAGGTDAIIVCGTTGESSTLTHEEHLDVIRFLRGARKRQDSRCGRHGFQLYGDGRLPLYRGGKVRRGRPAFGDALL